MFGFFKRKPRPDNNEAPVEPAREMPADSSVADAASPDVVGTPPAAPPTAAPAETAGWFSKLKDGLSKTRRELGGKLVGVFGVGRKLDEAFYEELETVLITADVGVAATEFLIQNLRA